LIWSRLTAGESRRVSPRFEFAVQCARCTLWFRLGNCHRPAIASILVYSRLSCVGEPIPSTNACWAAIQATYPSSRLKNTTGSTRIEHAPPVLVDNKEVEIEMLPVLQVFEVRLDCICNFMFMFQALNVFERYCQPSCDLETTK
jgi:hypothetical protein